MSDFNYSLDQFSYTDEQKVKIHTIAKFLQNQANIMGHPELFKNFNPEMLNSITFANLMVLSQYKKVLHQIEEIHYKTMRSIEFKTIEQLLKLVPEKIDYYNNTIPLMENSLRSRFTEVANDNEIFQRLYTYQDFKEQFASLMNKEVLTVEAINSYKKEDIFELCRQKIMRDKVDLETTFNEYEVITLDSLKNHERLYNLIASEFFHQYTQDSLQTTKFSGKLLLSEMIRPSHPLANKFGIEVHESVFLTVSLNPIPNLFLNKGDRMSYFDLMFEIKDEGEAYKLDIVWPLKLNHKTYFIQSAVYFNQYRLQLINGQRSNGWVKSA